MVIRRRSRTGTGHPERQECSRRSRAIRETFAEKGGGPAGDCVGVGAADGGGDVAGAVGAAGDGGPVGESVGEGGREGETVGEGEGETAGVVEERVGGRGRTDSAVGTATGSEEPQAASVRQATAATATRIGVVTAATATRIGVVTPATARTGALSIVSARADFPSIATARTCVPGPASLTCPPPPRIRPARCDLDGHTSYDTTAPSVALRIRHVTASRTSAGRDPPEGRDGGPDRPRILMFAAWSRCSGSGGGPCRRTGCSSGSAC
ncbi:hypothetical protein Pta02_37970 [Planobispora takensis]|uniref:Uncharacterized protein n=1 Tax=Planobispora takensis TaxID=1367882 RepID=A0A8J3T6A7_9ACTN|nr:hypothetical protein Pta02_37970 [Planobispora takensis]